jgi:hypothetical protein
MQRIFTLCAAVALLFAASARSQTADELVARHIEARGGLDKLKALESVKLTGKLLFTGDFALELALMELKRRPGMVREEVSLQGLTAVQAWDGSGGWQISPFQGRKDPERMSLDDSKDLIEDADIDGPLVDWQSKGNKVEYIGKEDVDGTDAHKLRVTSRDGDVQTIFLDPDYFLVIRIQRQRIVRGVEVESETDFGNYERVSGVLIPFSRETGPRGAPKSQRIVIEHAEANVPTDVGVFAFPGARAH